MIKSVCFTGHRDVIITPELQNCLYNLLEEMIQNGANIFLAGGASGFDLLCEKTVIKLREKYPAIQLHIIMPCPEIQQTQKWKNKSDIEQYHKILMLADKKELCSEYYTKDCMKKNERLIELADLCVCYYYRSRSGTGQTVRMAEKKKIKVINLYSQNDNFTKAAKSE